jgi:uncharacterized protein YjdB
VCLKWHAQFPVTQREIYRNNRVHTLQGNRNPFVDHPSYANSIYNPSTPYTEADPLGGTPVTAPNTITLSPSTPTIAVSQSVTLNVAVDTGSSSVNWTSSNNSVATVANGVVTGVAVGTATITATSTLNSEVTGTATVTVTETSVPVTGVSLNKNTLSLPVETSETLVATITPSNATNKSVTWTSSSPTIISVSSTGEVTAIEVGQVTITVTTEDGSFTDECTVTATPKSITPNGNGGCGGSIAITSGLIAALSAVGIVAILIKKKKYFIK